jgi:hypothetical protein
VILGGGKDGLPIIVGNVDAFPSTSPGSSTRNGDAISKERTTAAAPSTSSEKVLPDARKEAFGKDAVHPTAGSAGFSYPSR